VVNQDLMDAMNYINSMRPNLAVAEHAMRDSERAQAIRILSANFYNAESAREPTCTNVTAPSIFRISDLEQAYQGIQEQMEQHRREMEHREMVERHRQMELRINRDDNTLPSTVGRVGVGMHRGLPMYREPPRQRIIECHSSELEEVVENGESVFKVRISNGFITILAHAVLEIRRDERGMIRMTIREDVPQWKRYKMPDARRRFRMQQSHASGSELKARALLGRLIGEAALRKYLRDGFITYNGNDGSSYNIRTGPLMTYRWHDGRHVEILCVCFKDWSIPPTDSVVMRLLFLKNSEEEFSEACNRSDVLRVPAGHRLAEKPEKGRILKYAKMKAEGRLKIQNGKAYIRND